MYDETDTFNRLKYDFTKIEDIRTVPTEVLKDALCLYIEAAPKSVAYRTIHKSTREELITNAYWWPTASAKEHMAECLYKCMRGRPRNYSV